MAADLDHVRIVRLHGNSTDEREVTLVHLGGHLCERMGQLGRASHAPAPNHRSLLDNESCLDRILVPPTIEKHLSAAQWDSSNVADLVRHLDRKHEPLLLGRLQIEHLDAAKQEGAAVLLCQTTEAVKVAAIERAKSD